MTIYEPFKLLEEVESNALRLDIAELVTRNSHKRLREKLCAARFALGYERNIGSCRIDIDEIDRGERYDFHLLTSNGRFPFQIAEVLAPERKRHNEYRQLSLSEIQELNRTQIGGARRAAILVKTAILKKSKTYNCDERLAMHLLLYLNIGATSVTWASLASEVECCANLFASVWVLTHQYTSCLYGGRTWYEKVGWKSIDSRDAVPS
jgi:hypothetical protein